MPAERSAPTPAEQLSQALGRIAELESENAELRKEPRRVDVSSVPTPISILESITDAFVAVDRHFRYVWVNAEAERFTGMSRGQLLGHSIWEVFPEAVGTTLELKTRHALAEQIPVEFENYYAPWERWFHNKAYPTKEGGLAIYWRDITDQKRVQADLRRQALVLGQVHDAIIATDVEGIITHWNHGAAKMFGYESQEAIGRHISLLYFEEDRAQVRSAVLEPLWRDGQSEIEIRNRRKSGEECFIRLSLSQLRDDANEPYGMLGVATDITDPRQMERALRKSEEQYRCLADAMPQMAYITNNDGKTEMVNRHWERYSGLTAAECFELDWLSWVHPEDAPAIAPRWMECVRNGEPFDMEYRLRNSAGDYRWQLSRAIPVRDVQGAITHWVGTLTDIHERKSAEDALRESEERFRLASQAVDGIVYDWRLSTGVVHRSGNLESIVGLSTDQVEPTADWWQERVHPEDAAKSTLNIMPGLGNHRSSFETEFRIRHADGHWVYACDRGYVIRNEEGTPVRVVGSTINISERKRLEREIEENGKRLKFQADILATTNDAVIALDSNNLITYCNAGAERMYGVQSLDVVGKPLSAVHQYSWPNPEDERRASSDLAKHGSWKGENIHTRKDGTQIFVNSTVNVLGEDSGGGMVAVIRDISAGKKAEFESQKRSAELARANEDLLHFAYAVSHDLQTPLRTVTSFSQLLALKYKTSLDEQGGDFLRLIVQAGIAMTAMIRDLLELAKTAGSELTFDKAVSLEEALSTALDNLRSGIRETGAIITHDSLPIVAADAGQIAELFQNLIGNSLKYRKPGTVPEIHISAERNGQEWLIAVRDNGIGFEPREAERIFEVFKRLHGAEYSGTGVGLAICKRIVERRGGRIQASAAPGEGATFAFSIPDDMVDVRAQERQIRPPAVPVPMDRLPTVGAPFDELFHTLDLAQCIVRDLEGKILIWTQGAERLFGWPKSEAVGQHVYQLLRTEFPCPLQEIEAELLGKGEWKGELRKFRRDGSAVWLASHWALYRDGSGRPQSVIEVNNDITALKQAEAALLQSREQRDLALRGGQMGVWRWDSRTGVVEWDETVESFHGMPAGSFEGTFEAFQQRIHPEDRAMVEARISEALERGSEFTVEHRALRVDGQIVRLRGQGQVVREDGRAAGLIGVVWDITFRN